MTPLAARPPRNPEPKELIRRFLAHLAEEETFLVRMRDCLSQVRAALRHGDSAAVEAAFAGQQVLAKHTAELRGRREPLCQDCAAHYRTQPEAITLSFLAKRAGVKTRDRLLQARDRLRGLAAEVRTLDHGNITLAGHCQQFLQQLLQELTGAVPRGAAYGPTGAPRATDCAALIEVRG